MDTEVLALKWNNHQSIFYHIICGLRTKGSYTDVTLACEGKFYPVHKLVLSTCSEYFSEIFDRTPCKNPVVVLKDIQCKDLEFLLDYMYIGEVNVRQNELSSLIKAAECLKVKGLAVQEDEPKQLHSGTKQRLDHNRVTPNTPPPKRRRGEERRNSIPRLYDSFSDRYVKDTRLNESTQSSDASAPSLAPEQTEPLGDQSLDHDQDEQDQSRDADCEQVDAAPLTEIKVEQDLEYENNGNFDSSKASAPSSFDGDHYSEEPRSPKTEPDEAASVMDEGVIGVNFNELLQSSLTNDDSVDPHPSLHPQMNMDPSWESAPVGRGLPSHGLPSAVGSHNPLSHHQQQKAAVAALGLLQSSGSDSQSSLRLLQQQQGAANDLFNQQQNVMVGEGALVADYLQTKEKAMRDYVCQYCGREFGHRTNLQAHLRIHTGEKPFRCLYCPYRTALKGNLKMHTISRHKVDWKSIKHLVHPDDNSS